MAIIDNIKLTRELAHNIGRDNNGNNVIIKLYMSMAYDRVSRSFSCHMLRKLGFSEDWIDLIYKLISNI